MELPQSLRDAVVASLAGEIPVECGNASIQALVTMEEDETPSDATIRMANMWLEGQKEVQRQAAELVEDLLELAPVPTMGRDFFSTFPAYFTADWWFTVRYYQWANSLPEAIAQGREWLESQS